jgi:hypothetical protein
MSNDARVPFDLGPHWSAFRSEPFRNVFPRNGAWRYLDWTVEAGGYRLVIDHGAIVGLEALGEPYTCDNCGGSFTKTWSDEEAMAEAEALYPAEDLEEGLGIVCDDCFQVIMVWARQEMPEHLTGTLSAGPIGDART